MELHRYVTWGRAVVLVGQWPSDSIHDESRRRVYLVVSERNHLEYRDRFSFPASWDCYMQQKCGRPIYIDLDIFYEKSTKGVSDCINNFKHAAVVNEWYSRKYMIFLPSFLRGAASRTQLHIIDTFDCLAAALSAAFVRLGETDIAKISYDMLSMCSRLYAAMSEENTISFILRELRPNIVKKKLIKIILKIEADSYYTTNKCLMQACGRTGKNASATVTQVTTTLQGIADYNIIKHLHNTTNCLGQQMQEIMANIRSLKHQVRKQSRRGLEILEVVLHLDHREILRADLLFWLWQGRSLNRVLLINCQIKYRLQEIGELYQTLTHIIYLTFKWGKIFYTLPESILTSPINGIFPVCDFSLKYRAQNFSMAKGQG
ncbi:hypothetical protein PR048_011332 [Dryococelus australis]|uniref:Uncharacterized protein n=1 Tax=Dryococelus australis TaxID=614101 RepID=A0ABQ9HLA1_9NEOP|nr:hypothetical protein PR048_011332 [Dryococelus australis]